MLESLNFTIVSVLTSSSLTKPLVSARRERLESSSIREIILMEVESL